jgi:hypothetical protein
VLARTTPSRRYRQRPTAYLAALWTLAVLATGCFASAGDRLRPQESTDASSATLEAPPVRGMWVWKTAPRLAREDGIAMLLESCREAGVNEVYLSTGGVLDHPRLPEMVAALHGEGIRIEALFGEAAWYQPERRASMLAEIEAVSAYNARVPAAARFAAVHLDIEPHQLPQNKGDHRFLPALAETLAEARTRASARGLDTSVDLPRFALEENGAAFARAAPRIFLMLYELRDSSPAALASASARVLDGTYQGLPATSVGRIVVGVSVDDYPSDLESALRALEGAHPTRPRYAGWAIHDEARYRARPRR